MAAEQKARTTYDNILALSKNEDVNKVIRFLEKEKSCIINVLLKDLNMSRVN
ncbi:MAG: hypothetical protein V8R62_13925 [Faecalibacillus intestinalis]